MELKRWLLLIFSVLLSFQNVCAQNAVGIELIEVPTGSFSSVDTEIEATIENWGYEKIFVALPAGWTVDNQKSGISKSFAVREEGLWRIYGMKASLGKTIPPVYGGRDFEKNTLITKSPATIGTRTGWWLRPNEGINIDVYISGISASGGIVDPWKIEKENPSIRVDKWYESFTIEVSKPGLITAPWTVEGASLVESNPSVYSSADKKGTAVYYEKYQKDIATNAPAWDEWFDLKSSLVYMMTDSRLAAIDLEFPDIDETSVEATTKPIWRVDNIADITYAYQWKSYKKIEGITLLGNTELDIPEWFELF